MGKNQGIGSYFSDKNLKLNKNSNIKDLNTRILRDCLTLTSKEVTYLFNCVCTSGIYPASWKEALVVPIFKSGNKSKVNNYRPISLLPLLSKIMEKLLHKRLLCFLNVSNFFTECQSGFRPTLGVNDSIDSLLDYTFQNINNNKIILTIFYDLSKA